MEQPKNLLSEFNVTSKHPASYWQGRMMALKVGGLDDFRTTLDAALKSDNPAVVEEAQGALRVLKRIAQKLGVTREAVVGIFGRLQAQYLNARNTTAKGMKIKRGTPAAQVYQEFPSLYATCHAHAEAALPVLNEQIDAQEINLAAEEQPAPAATKTGDSSEVIPLKGDDTPGLAAEEPTQTPPSTGPEPDEDELDAFFRSAGTGSSSAPGKRKG